MACIYERKKVAGWWGWWCTACATSHCDYYCR